MNLGVVYHAYLINHWKDLVSRQLARLYQSGLMTSSKVIMTANLANEKEQELKNILEPYLSYIELRTFRENLFEYPGCQAVYDLASTNQFDGLLYFHTKGVYNRFSSFQTMEQDDQIIQGVQSWSNIMEYFLIDDWKRTTRQLEQVDQCGYFFEWPKGETANFWWATPSLIKSLGAPEKSRLDRCVYERWAINQGKHKRYNVFPYLKANPYMSIYNDKLFTHFYGKKINIHQAFYGNFSPNDLTDTVISKNVTRHVRQFLSSDSRTFDVVVGNKTIEQDPYYGRRKKLRIHCSFEGEYDSFVLVGDENTRFYFSTVQEIT
jgi:hypothetical protein